LLELHLLEEVAVGLAGYLQNGSLCSWPYFVFPNPNPNAAVTLKSKVALAQSLKIRSNTVQKLTGTRFPAPVSLQACTSLRCVKHARHYDAFLLQDEQLPELVLGWMVCEGWMD